MTTSSVLGWLICIPQGRTWRRRPAARLAVRRALPVRKAAVCSVLCIRFKLSEPKTAMVSTPTLDDLEAICLETPPGRQASCGRLRTSRAATHHANDPHATGRRLPLRIRRPADSPSLCKPDMVYTLDRGHGLHSLVNLTQR